MRRGTFLLLTLAAAYAPALAHANGRFPRAQQIVVDPADENHLALRATFGVTISRDGGKSWSWLCEEAMGFSGAWDPPIAFGNDGSLLIGLTDGIVSTRDACVMQRAMKGELVSDLSRAPDGDLIATSTASDPGKLWRRGKEGRSTLLGKGIAGIYLDTVDAAPSKPSRVYATGVQIGEPAQAHLFVSDDGGATLKELTPVLPTRGRLFLAAVDPRDPMHLFVRQLGETGSDLLVSGDGGHSFAVALHMDGAMYGFAMDAVGNDLWVGSADESQGIWASHNGGVTFAQAAKVIVYCLARRGAALYVCSEPFRSGGYAVGVSRDDGVTVAPLATFADVTGPVLCDGGDGARCQGDAWTKMRATLLTASTKKASALDAINGTDSSTLIAHDDEPTKPSRCLCETRPSRPDRSLVSIVLLAVALLVSRRAPWIKR